jgi:hypothetical protein
MGKIGYFRVYNTQVGDHIAVVEMDEDLLAPDADILDHKTATLRHLKGGSAYTLVPIEHHKIAVLKRVKEVYENITTKPAKLFTTHISRMDDLLGIVGLLFGDVEYTVVKSKEDMANLLNPPRDYEPKKVKYKVLDEMLAEAEAEGGDEHKCGSGCGHNHSDDS